MAQQLEDAIIRLRAALRATAWSDHELTAALVREARDACDEWLREVADVRTPVGSGMNPAPTSADGVPLPAQPAGRLPGADLAY
ncbi:MAG: hypothetical protein J2P43_00235 [Candidatus Dormibacteraeota bacterium]|nr:hypothetical protein [Candidatus Dormibacteraeota bacterium]